MTSNANSALDTEINAKLRLYIYDLNIYDSIGNSSHGVNMDPSKALPFTANDLQVICTHRYPHTRLKERLGLPNTTQLGYLVEQAGARCMEDRCSVI